MLKIEQVKIAFKVNKKYYFIQVSNIHMIKSDHKYYGGIRSTQVCTMFNLSLLRQTVLPEKSLNASCMCSVKFSEHSRMKTLLTPEVARYILKKKTCNNINLAR